ncbi:MAG: hypothetical protein UV80_C0010G0004 [Candidatus Peregrinibacteria bacterium GW2011_GWF2_43_17]|nr:MAG: hypothetical protein UV80_C0010G0004 [Candidatus Peregrinibacteria bacterium GW2011_GWF2_43_17]
MIVESFGGWRVDGEALRRAFEEPARTEGAQAVAFETSVIAQRTREALTALSAQLSPFADSDQDSSYACPECSAK